MAEIDLRGVWLIVLKSELDVVHDLDLVVVQIQNLLVEDMILKQDQILLRRSLEWRQILADVENDLLIGNEPHSIPWNRQRGEEAGAVLRYPDRARGSSSSCQDALRLEHERGLGAGRGREPSNTMSSAAPASSGLFKAPKYPSIRRPRS